MVQYKVSAYITITGVDEDNEDVPFKYLDDYYILYNEVRDKEFLINSTIKYFIDKFSTPATEIEVLERVQNDVNSTHSAIEQTCSDFFKFLVKRKIVVPADKEEPSIDGEPLFEEGNFIDNYKVENILSDKRYLDIYLATDTLTNQKTVIKLLNGKKLGDSKAFEQELSYLEREYSLLESVKHVPVINKVYSLNKDKEHYAYIALEYLEGTNLSRFLKDTDLLTEKDCLQLIGGVVNAFSLLHQCNLIHGDIHPSNVMIGEDRSVKIIDLGLSRAVETDKDEVLKHGGVNFYMPPERINISSVKKFSKEPDLYSDVYQVGLLVYLILYKTTPFEGFIWEELAKNIKEQNIVYPDVSIHNFLVPSCLTVVIGKCTDKNPVNRYRNAGEILVDLEKNVFKQQEELVN